MKARTVVEGIQWVGAVDWDRRSFDELVPLPSGTSYNAYWVKGSEKTALVDAVDPKFMHQLLERLENEGIKHIDYLVSNHTEQDHSGGIPAVLERYPDVQILSTERAREMLADHLGLDASRIRAVKDGEKISLGDLTLEFIHFPWVHWPETMLTYVPERKTLLSCDLFGSHLATGELFAVDEGEVMLFAKRYYAEIMMPFHSFIEKSMPKVMAREIKIIAPSHGPVYQNPKVILDAYREWTSAPPRNLVVVPYISMHGSTRIMVEHFVAACAERGVRAEQFDLVEPDLGRLAMMLVDAASVVLGTPTVLGEAHPNVSHAAMLANLLKPKTKYLSIIGSYGWGGKTVERLSAMIPNLKVETLPPVLCKGLPKKADLEALDRLADTLAEKHKGLV
jgi:flavorubredoxin